MKLYVGITDENWFNHLRELQPDEVNFWRPLARTPFRVLNSGELFLFKMHYPKRMIAGGGTFVSYSRLPLSVAWETFGQKNGTADEQSLQALIHKYRERQGFAFEPDPMIGCIILNNPFFLDPQDWLPEPADWQPSIVQGKGYDTNSLVGADLLEQVSALQRTSGHLATSVTREDNTPLSDDIEDIAEDDLSDEDVEDSAESERFGSEYITRGRLGQGAFRVLVTEAYQRRCAMTGYGAIPALQASHIKPYAQYGPHRVCNGLLLRVDLHVLFDKGYITIDQAYKIIVSSKLSTDYEYTDEYYELHGRSLMILPKSTKDCPSEEYIEWHNSNVFQT